MTTLRIGVSTCLTGVRCRYDGDHNLVTALLRAPVTLVPVCPEVALGMPVPREPIGLVGPARAPALLGEETGTDWTERMRAWAEARVAALAAEGLDGFVLKSRSPSCGLGSTKRRPAPGAEPVRDGTGLFAAALVRALPGLPVIEETALEAPGALEAFLARARAYRGG